MTNVSFEAAIGHSLTIIEGHTGFQFTGGADAAQFAEARSPEDTTVNGTWISDPITIRQGSQMCFMAKSVHVQISTNVYLGTVGIQAHRNLPVGLDARGRFQVNVVMAFTGHTGIVFNTARTIHFNGAHFFHFD